MAEFTAFTASDAEVERVARILFEATRKYVSPEPPRREWIPTADFLDMARAVIADSERMSRGRDDG